jgi:predicted acetyltransferase
MELVNPVPVTEIEPWLSALATTLLGSPWDEEFPGWVERWRRDWPEGRTWGVRDRGRWVATLATDPRIVTVPGADGATVDLMADALTGVTVAATHTRRGLLRRMITQSLGAAVDRGDAVAILIAAEWPIYGRFGYAPSTRNADYTLFPRFAGASVSPDPSGSVRQIDPQELGRYAPTIFDDARRRLAGQVARPGDWWNRRLGLDGYRPQKSGQGTWIVHESEGVPDGLLAWKVERDFETNGEMGAVKVMELVAASAAAYRNLWAYLCTLDVISEVNLHHRSADEPVRWLLHDGRALRQHGTNDDLWLRLLDVAAALSARRYAVPGRLVIEVLDEDLGGYAAGRYVLDAGPDGAACTRTTETSDLRLPQRALASAYLGDHSVRELMITGAIDELSPGAVATADSMFATAQLPWNATAF